MKIPMFIIIIIFWGFIFVRICMQLYQFTLKNTLNEVMEKTGSFLCIYQLLFFFFELVNASYAGD